MTTSTPRVLIATPSYGGTVTTRYTASLVKIMQGISGIDFRIQFLDYALICKQRNFFISRLLQEDFTHLLFIDADMGFTPEAVKALFEIDQPIAACAYPKRRLDWEQIPKATVESTDKRKAQALSFVCEHNLNQGVKASLSADRQQMSLKHGKFIRCDLAGTGLMLIKKTVPEQLKAAYPELWVDSPIDPYTNFGKLDGILQCFEGVQNEQGQYLSEDLSFCQRWTEGCQGDIWVNISDSISHTGTQTFEAAFLDRFIDR